MVKKNGTETWKSLQFFFQDGTLRFISVDIDFCEDERLYGLIVTFVHGEILKILWNLFLQLSNM